MAAAVSMAFADNTVVAEFATTEHDFGTISASGGKVTTTYEVTNLGTSPLVILSVTNGGCGCTEPSFTRSPILPGKKGEVTITFDPKKFSGEFNRRVTVTTNAKKPKQKLRFSGYIKP